MNSKRQVKGKLGHVIQIRVCRLPFDVNAMFKLSNGDFGAIPWTEQSCATPISKVESHVSDKCAYYIG